MGDRNLKKAVQDALENYHDLDALEHSPLVHFQSALLLRPPMISLSAASLLSPGITVRRLLDEAMTRLDRDQPEAAALLRKRYRQGRSAQALAIEHSISPSTFHDHRSKAVAALAAIVGDMEAEADTTSFAKVRSLTMNLPAPTYGEFIGHESSLTEVKRALSAGTSSRSPFVVTGLGGLGKTSLIREAITHLVMQQRLQVKHILWATVVQNADPVGLPSENHEQYSIEQVLNQLGLQLDEPLAIAPSLEQRLRIMVERLSREPSVVVIDNVETPDEVHVALTLVEALASVAQIVVTSRHRINHPGVQSIDLRDLTQAEAVRLLDGEAQRLDIEPLNESATRAIWELIGGNPLALKLIIAQTCFLPTSQVLYGLHRHSGSFEQALVHVYATAWELLSPAAREIFTALIALPLLGATWEGLRVLTGFTDNSDVPTVERALGELHTLNLLQVSPALDPVYSLHRLTYRFLEQKAGLGSGSGEAAW